MTLWVNGSLVDPDRPNLRADDHGFTVGDGVFEAMRVVDGQPFALRRHLRRLADSAAGLGIELDLDRVRAAVAEVLDVDDAAARPAADHRDRRPVAVRHRPWRALCRR